jgi:hypothetical protein
MVSVPATDANIGLAASVNNRIRSDSTMLAARAAAWRLGGIGVLALCMGVAIGAALFGYSYVNDNYRLSERVGSTIATAIGSALEHAKITGTVDMTPGKVALEPGGTVTMLPGAVTGTVRVVEDHIRPTERQLSGTAPVQPGGKTVTNFTIFKTTVFGKGSVVTGWDFASNEQDLPTSQFCYYSESSNDTKIVSIRVNLAHDGQLLNDARTYTNIDSQKAAAQCVWFNGMKTRM